MFFTCFIFSLFIEIFKSCLDFLFLDKRMSLVFVVFRDNLLFINVQPICETIIQRTRSGRIVKPPNRLNL